MKQKWVDPDDAPELTGKEAHRPDARWRIGGKVVSAKEGRAAFRVALRGEKTRVNIHLDNDVIAFFKEKAGDQGGYQTLINAVLRQFVEGSLESAKFRPQETAVLAEIQEVLNEVRKLRDEVVAPRLSQVRVLEIRQSLEGLTQSSGMESQIVTQSNNELILRLNS